MKPYYEVQYDPRDGYLYCHVTGQTSYEVGLALWREIASKSKELGYSKILVDEELNGQVTNMEMYQLINELSKADLRGLKIAFTDRHATDNPGNQFGETVGRNRGIITMIFHDLEKAKDWLMQNIKTDVTIKSND